MKTPKIGWLAGLLLAFLLFLLLSTCGGETSTPTSLTPQGLLGDTPIPGAAAASPTAEIFVQLDGQPIQPQLSPITAVIDPGTQWVLKDLWEDYVCRNIEGRIICYDWAFFCQLGGTRCLVAECMDPFWDLPTRGMVYTANSQVAASTSMVLIPPTDIPAPEEGWQKFLTIYEILNTGLVLPSPTASLTSQPADAATVVATGTTIPGATSFVVAGTAIPAESAVPQGTSTRSQNPFMRFLQAAGIYVLVVLGIFALIILRFWLQARGSRR